MTCTCTQPCALDLALVAMEAELLKKNASVCSATRILKSRCAVLFNVCSAEIGEVC